jgi:hypothetical protein
VRRPGSGRAPAARCRVRRAAAGCGSWRLGSSGAARAHSAAQGCERTTIRGRRRRRDRPLDGDALLRRQGRLFAAALGPERAARAAGLVAAQLLGLALTRYLLRLPPVASLTPDELVAGLAPALAATLAGGTGS